MNTIVESHANGRPVVTASFDSVLGNIILAADGKALLGVWFRGQKHFAGVSDSWVSQPDHPVLAQTQGQLADYLAGHRDKFDLPLSPRGTLFQQQVWQALLTIPFGQRVSYGQLAKQLGAPRGARPVAAAIGRNPISVIVPCHRVVGANGALTGYAGGLDRKRRLLALEGRANYDRCPADKTASTRKSG